MNQLPIFTSGFELANLVVNSNLLHLSWSSICALQAEANPFHHHQQQPLSLRCRVDKQLNFTIVALGTSPSCLIHHLQQEGDQGDLVSSIALKQENFPLFEFLCSKGNPSFSINRAAIALFYRHFSELSLLRTQFVDPVTGNLSVNTPLIITGNSLGGSVASLFTLWLLDSINQPSTKRPFCITFGSPLIGDSGLRRAISERSTWNSCFLHVAANRDPAPSLFLPPLTPHPLASTPQTIVYMPFGSFLLCSELGCTCVDDPEVVARLLEAMALGSTGSQVSDEHLLSYYTAIVENLKARLILKGSSLRGLSITNSLEAGTILQLEAIGDTRFQQPQHNMDFSNLIAKLKEREQICMLNKRKALNPSRKLNDIKIKMAFLEWYKKSCKANQIGYYDSYKNNLSISDREVTKYKKFLTKYWKDMVEEAEKKPHKERAFIRSAWLFAGTNYRRMVEPLDIAEYYRTCSKRNYETEGRSKHYFLLEKWQKKEAGTPAEPPSNKKKQNVAGTLTEDSCFWAKVEEAIISCELLKAPTSSAMEAQSSREYLINFERYVMEQIKNYAVSPEIFLRGSSLMKWWGMYQDIASNFELIDFMKNCRSVQYEKGCF